MIHFMELTSVRTVSRCPSPASTQAKGCCLCLGSNDHIRMLESAEAEANIFGSAGDISRSMTSYHAQGHGQSVPRWTPYNDLIVANLHLHALLESIEKD